MCIGLVRADGQFQTIPKGSNLMGECISRIFSIKISFIPSIKTLFVHGNSANDDVQDVHVCETTMSECGTN